jgi:hypothetical protein
MANRGTVSVRVNPLQGNGIDTYCKITQYEYADGTKNKYTFSFGTGRGQFCLIVSIDGKNYSSAYIDRVEKVEKCSKGRGMTEIADGMAKYTSLGLYAVTRMCPWVKRFTLKDDSKTICNGISGPSIRLAYDYLLKYNMTWYQKKFGACLEGVVGAGEEKDEAGGDIETFSSPGFQEIRAVKGSLMYQYMKSLEALDEPCKEFALLRDLFPELKEYQELYESARSPRDFLTRVRSQFPDPASFCRGVSSWFDRYMGYLRIQLFMDSWFIPVERVQEPNGFFVGKSVKESVLNTYQGGTRRNRKVKGKKRDQTRSQPLQGVMSGIDGLGVESFG